MSSYKKSIPANVIELREYLKQIHESRSHVKSVHVNTNNYHLEIQLDMGAHLTGHPDMYMPLKHGMVNQAVLLVENMLRHSASGFPPSELEAVHLFDMIDPVGQ